MKPLAHWQRAKDLEAFGFDSSTKHFNKISVHNTNETERHLFAKCVICKKLRKLDRIFVTEARLGAGIVDILDLSTGYIYEIESAPTEATKKKKMIQYKNHFIPDILFVNIDKMPDDIRKAAKWLEDRVV